MKPLGLLVCVLASAAAADRNTIVQDPAVSRAIKDRYVALVDSWVRGIEYTPAEAAAMEAGKKIEPLLMQGPDDPVAKKILAAGEPSFDALAAVYPGKILDRTVLGSYSDPLQPMGAYPDEFAIHWNGAIACNLIKGRLTDRYGATGVQPLSHNTVVVFHVGPNGDAFGRVRSKYTSIGYENGYLPIVTAAYELDGVRYRETAFADRPAGESGGWDIAHVQFEMTNLSRESRVAVLRPEVILSDEGKMTIEGGLVLDGKGAVLLSVSDTRREFPLKAGETAAVAMKIPYIPDAKRLMRAATL